MSTPCLMIRTVDQVYQEMMDDAEALTDENYHTEAGFLEDQAVAMKNAAQLGYVLGYFSYSASELAGGVKEFILVRE